MKKRAHIPHNFEMTFETCQYISSGEREKRKQAFSKTQDCERGKTEEKHTINKRPTRKPSGYFFVHLSLTGSLGHLDPTRYVIHSIPQVFQSLTGSLGLLDR